MLNNIGIVHITRIKAINAIEIEILRFFGLKKINNNAITADGMLQARLIATPMFKLSSVKSGLKMSIALIAILNANNAEFPNKKYIKTDGLGLSSNDV